MAPAEVGFLILRAPATCRAGAAVHRVTAVDLLGGSSGALGSGPILPQRAADPIERHVRAGRAATMCRPIRRADRTPRFSWPRRHNVPADPPSRSSATFRRPGRPQRARRFRRAVDWNIVAVAAQCATARRVRAGRSAATCRPAEPSHVAAGRAAGTCSPGRSSTAFGWARPIPGTAPPPRCTGAGLEDLEFRGGRPFPHPVPACRTRRAGCDTPIGGARHADRACSGRTIRTGGMAWTRTRT